MIYFLYNFLLIAVTIAGAPYFSVKLATSEKYRDGFGQRMGRLPKEVGASGGKGKCLWMHAVSVGEVMAGAPIIEELRRRYPELRIVLSTVTRTGNQTAREKVKAADHIVYFPFDYPWIVNKVIKQIAPDTVAIVETEIWPNFLRKLQRDSIPSIIINGRISPSSFKGYSKVQFFMKKVLSGVSLFSMQTEEDARRVVELGADSMVVTVTGNVKFDQALSPPSPAQIERFKKMFRLNNQPLFLAGSTHEGEEEAVLTAFGKLKKEFPDLRLIIAPRHPERWDRVEKLIIAKGYSVGRRSRLHADGGGLERDSVILLDTIGELTLLYALATVVFVGGSLVPTGGHNVLEPAARGKAVLFGPHMFNFQEIARMMLEMGGGLEVKNTEELIEKASGLLQDTGDRKDRGLRALNVVRSNRGAVKRNVELVEKCLNLSAEAAKG